jgi:hypothetical protein
MSEATRNRALRHAVAHAVASTSLRNRCRVLSHTASRTRPPCVVHSTPVRSRLASLQRTRATVCSRRPRAADTHRKDSQPIRFHARLESLAVALLTLITIFIKIIAIVSVAADRGVLVKDANSEPRCKHSVAKAVRYEVRSERKWVVGKGSKSRRVGRDGTSARD